MNLYEIRSALQKGSKIYDLKLRVCYYARVSTDKYDQLNSLTNQVEYYDNYIKNNSNWTFAGSYVDEGVSGTSTKNRTSFKKMINDAEKGKFDLIVTKEISRFARDTLDSIKYTRKLLENGIGVYFQNDNILTFEPESELRLTIMASIAQEEVRKLSERVKFGFQRQIEKGSALGNDYIWGYVKDKTPKKRGDKRKLIVVEEEAKIIRLIYDMYVNDNIGMRKIGIKLKELGYVSKTGKPFAQSTIKSILTNPKYKGYYCGNKTRVVDYHSKKRVNINESDWVLYKDADIPQIIDEETWNKAQSIINKKSAKLSSDKRVYQNRYPFSGKIFCMEHRKTYRRKKQISSGIKKKTIVTWRCANFLLYNKEGCNSPILYEEELTEVVTKTILKYLASESIINELIEEYRNCNDKGEIDNLIKNKQKEIEKLNVYKNNLYTLLRENTIMIDEFKNKITEIEVEINSVKCELEKLTSSNNMANKEEELNKLKKIAVSKLQIDNADSDSLIREFLDSIEVFESTDDIFKINIVLNIGKTTSVNYNNQKHHFCTYNTYDKSRC